MIRAIAVLAAAALVLGATTVQAQQKPRIEYWYFGAGYGESKTRFENSDFNSAQLGVPGITDIKDESDAAYKVFAGYQWTELWGIEFGYANLGKATYSYSPPLNNINIVDYEPSTYFLVATGTVPLGESFGLMVRLGAARNTVQASVRNSGGQNAKDRNTGFVAGVGVHWKFGNTWGLRFDFDDFGKFGDADTTGRAKGQLATVNLIARF